MLCEAAQKARTRARTLPRQFFLDCRAKPYDVMLVLCILLTSLRPDQTSHGLNETCLSAVTVLLKLRVLHWIRYQFTFSLC